MKVVWCSEIKGIILILSCHNSSVHRQNIVRDLSNISDLLVLYMGSLISQMVAGSMCAASSSIHLLHVFMQTPVCYFWQYLKMSTLIERCVCTKFCFKLGKTFETFKLLLRVFDDETKSCMTTYKWHRKFIDNQTTIEDYPCLGSLQPQPTAIPLSKV